MRPERLYLGDILEAAQAAGRFCADMNEGEFLQDEIRQSAVLQKLIVIGEAAARLPKSFQESHPEVEWQDIIGFRNIAVHAYFAVTWEIVWNTVIQDIPLLKAKIENILNEEFSE